MDERGDDSPRRRVTFDQLIEFDQELRRLFPDVSPSSYLGLNSLGLYLDPKLEPGGYWCSPTNCRSFAWTVGGAGVHFGFLEQNGRNEGDGPIVVTIPEGGGFTFIVGESLHDFLCFGSLRMFFAMDQLSWKREVTLEAFTNADWQPTEPWHESQGFVPGDGQRSMLALMTTRFDLQPWPGPERFDELQARYLDQIVTDYDAY